jgi:2-phosphosulfolactate phosphatase
MEKHFVIDAFPESATRYRRGYVVVAVDVIRATTMAITAVAEGRRCFPVASLEQARSLAATLEDPLVAGELKGDMPPGFHMNNSPAELAARTDIGRPLVMLSSSGTLLMSNAAGADAVYLACFRNYSSLSRTLAATGHRRIALIGAGSRGEFRDEDQIGCALVAAGLLREGYKAHNAATAAVLKRWSGAGPADCLHSKSVDYLRRTGQLADLDFILSHVDDLDYAYALRNGEVVAEANRAAAELARAASGQSEAACQ